MGYRRRDEMREVGRHPDEKGVSPGTEQEDDAGNLQDPQRYLAERLEDGALFDVPGTLQADELRRLLDATAHPPADDADQHTTEKRQAPAPRLHLLRGQEIMHQRRHRRAEQHPADGTGRYPAAGQPASIDGGGSDEVAARADVL